MGNLINQKMTLKVSKSIPATDLGTGGGLDIYLVIPVIVEYIVLATIFTILRHVQVGTNGKIIYSIRPSNQELMHIGTS